MTDACDPTESALAALLNRPPSARLAHLLADDAPERLFQRLADRVERMAMVRVEAAANASDALLQVAESWGEPGARARARRARAQALAYGGCFHDALPLCEQAIELARAADLREEEGRAHLARTHALVGLARYDEAIRSSRTALAIFSENHLDTLAGRAETSLGGLHQKCGQHHEALRHFDRARELLHDQPVALGQLESNRGLALLSLDDFDGAERAYRDALPRFTSAEMGWAAAIVENNLAVLMTRQGRLHEALHFFERARQHLEHDAAPAEMARLLAEQADALVTVGACAEARDQYLEVLTRLDDTGQAREAAQAREGVGLVLAHLGEYDNAEKWLEEASDAYQKLSQAVARGRVDVLRAALALRKGLLERAGRMLRRAQGVFGDQPLEQARADYHGAHLALLQGDAAGAERILEPSLRVADELDVPPLRADLLHLRGRVRRNLGRTGEALADFARAADDVDRVRSALQADRFRAAFQANRLSVFEDLALTALEQRPPNRRVAFDAIERAKGRALLDLLPDSDTRDHGAQSSHDRAAERLNAALEEKRRHLNALYSRLADAMHSGRLPGNLDWNQQIAECERDVARLESRLAAQAPAATPLARPAALPDVQALLEPGTALLEYYITHGELIAMVVRRDDVAVIRDVCSESEFTAALERVGFQMRRALRPAALHAQRQQRLIGDAQCALARAYDTVLRPLEPHIADAQRLTIVPSGPLHATPWSALWDGTAYALDRWEIATAPSAAIWARLRQTIQPDLALGRCLIVGVADEAAPHIDDEARTLARHIPGATILLGDQATADAVLSEAAGADIVHLACHGQFVVATPHASGLRLADRWLSIAEWRRARIHAGHVTLSGCETGRNVVAAGDELQGFARAFLAAGARSLIVSLWMVHDESARRLMTAVYNRVHDHSFPEGRAWTGALRSAQRELMTEFAHPAYWAAFQIVGDA